MSRIELHEVDPCDRKYVERLLAESGLPTSDLDAAYSSLFVCESAAGESVGVGGLEIEGDAGLLRSVAVEASARGTGYGTAICEQLVDRARTADLNAVFLLTTNATGFFENFGFERTERERVPDRIRGTAEFTDLCPTDAICMRLELE